MADGYCYHDFKYIFRGDLLKTKIALCHSFPLSSLFFCHTFMFNCFCASFKSLKKLPLHHSLQQMLLEGAEVDVKERHIFPKDCECVQLKQLQNWQHSASGELKRIGEDFGLKIKIIFKILDYLNYF